MPSHVVPTTSPLGGVSKQAVKFAEVIQDLLCVRALDWVATIWKVRDDAFQSSVDVADQLLDALIHSSPARLT
jgi:hypothetical protein